MKPQRCRVCDELVPVEKKFCSACGARLDPSALKTLSDWCRVIFIFLLGVGIAAAVGWFSAGCIGLMGISAQSDTARLWEWRGMVLGLISGGVVLALWLIAMVRIMDKRAKLHEVRVVLGAGCLALVATLVNMLVITDMNWTLVMVVKVGIAVLCLYVAFKLLK